MTGNSFSFPGGKMKGNCIIAGLIFLLIAGLAGAEYHTTTISTDGSVMLSSAGVDENGSVGSRVMALDSAKVSRTIDDDKGISEDLIVSTAGPMLFSEFASAIMKHPKSTAACTFLDETDGQIFSEASRVLSGILQNGEVDSSRTGGPDYSDMVAVNGSGMIYIGSQKRGNRSLDSQGFVSGNMSVQDFIRNGGKI